MGPKFLYLYETILLPCLEQAAIEIYPESVTLIPQSYLIFI
jgi:hypothetical protein